MHVPSRLLWTSRRWPCLRPYPGDKPSLGTIWCWSLSCFWNHKPQTWDRGERGALVFQAVMQSVCPGAGVREGPGGTGHQDPARPSLSGKRSWSETKGWQCSASLFSVLMKICPCLHSTKTNRLRPMVLPFMSLLSCSLMPCSVGDSEALSPLGS